MEQKIGALLLDLENELIDRETRRSESRLNELLSDEFIEIGASGTLYSKPEIVAALLAESGTIHRQVHDYRCRQLAADVYLVTYRSDATFGRDVRTSYRSSIWALKDGRFQLEFHQGTLVPPADQ